MKYRPLALIAITFLLCLPALAQRGGRGGPPASGRQAAPIDLTGYWVSTVMEDWKFRMVTPRKGIFETLPLNAEGRRVGETWDPARDEASGEQCRAYGAPGLMRLPGRLHITWENDNALRIETDAGTQTRLFYFGATAPAAGEPSWQGRSVAQWELGAGGGRGQGQPRTGDLKVMTTNLRPGLRAEERSALTARTPPSRNFTISIPCRMAISG